MGSAARVSEQTYLRTSYQPDREYADGVLIERNAGERDHSWLQAALVAYLFRRRKSWRIEVFTGQRHLIRPGRYMIPDVCVVWSPMPAEQVFDKPPLVWIEILSHEDRPIRVNEKVRELQDFGADSIWIIDPETLEAEIHTRSQRVRVEGGVLCVEGTLIEVRLHDLEND
jgi:Uma2 family endonuclease